MLYKNILVPYDGSESAHAALKEALKFAHQDSTLTLRIIQIVDVEQLVIHELEAEGRNRESLTSSEEVHDLFDRVTHKAQVSLHERIDSLIKGLMNKVVVEMLEETIPSEQIIAYEEDNGCDLIVMGSRGLGALRGMLGSVSSYVARYAAVPVLIVKQPE